MPAKEELSMLSRKIQEVQVGKLQFDEDVRVQGLHLLGGTLNCS